MRPWIGLAYEYRCRLNSKRLCNPVYRSAKLITRDSLAPVNS